MLKVAPNLGVKSWGNCCDFQEVRPIWRVANYALRSLRHGDFVGDTLPEYINKAERLQGRGKLESTAAAGVLVAPILHASAIATWERWYLS
jgi:hypothetical protein